MDVFTSLGILILSALIASSLMLVPGVFASFFHYASGKYSREKADHLSLFFIIGVEAMVVLVFFLIATIIWALPFLSININNQILIWIFVGIFIALSIATCLFYIKKDGRLFISRKTATRLLEKPRYIKNRSDAFMLGFVSAVPELPFTIPLYAVSAFIIMNINPSPTVTAFSIVLYSLVTTIPLFITHCYFRTGHNLANIIRFRLKNRNFFRFFISSLYLILAIILIILGILP